MKLIKYITSCGCGSRRECEQLIKEKKVYVNGKITDDFNHVINPEKDYIKINNKIIKQTPKVYIALNKPVGYITTVDDEFNRPTVMELIKKKRGSLYPVGRLDLNSEGLIFLTNDGDWANKITHPKNNISKTYSVKVSGDNIQYKIKKLYKGIFINKRKIVPDYIKIIKNNPKSTWIEIVIHSGENRIIRKLCENNNLTVQKLIRTKIGNYKLKNLKKGEYKILDYQVALKIINNHSK